jgi:hypothetical protein
MELSVGGQGTRRVKNMAVIRGRFLEEATELHVMRSTFFDRDYRKIQQ